MRAIASWSGGKDSCLAYYKAISQGVQVSYLLNMINKDASKSMSHGLDPKLIALQAKAMGVPIIQRETTWETYEAEFKEAIGELKQKGVNAGVFGDIDLQEHREWVERVCGELGIKPILPLWGLEPERILRDFVGLGFEAIVVCTKGDLMGKEWLGEKIDTETVDRLLRVGNIHPCGESGEYHTFVINGPIFSQCLQIVDTKLVQRKGYWFLDILRCKLGQK